MLRIFFSMCHIHSQGIHLIALINVSSRSATITVGEVKMAEHWRMTHSQEALIHPTKM